MSTNFLDQTEIEATDPKSAEIYKNLQGNILKGHGRDHATMIFVNFGDTSKGIIKKAISSFANDHVTSFYTQLWERERYKRNQTPGNTFGAVLFTQKGLNFLGDAIKQNDPAFDIAFDEGMSASAEKLLDDPAIVEEEYKKEIHALFLLADDDKTTLDMLVIQLLAEVWKGEPKKKGEEPESIFNLLHIEYGDAIRNANGDGLEHNGYVDGVSQPLFLKDEVDAYKKHHNIEDGNFKFDPRAKPGLVLVKDPNVKENDGVYGSYFVFRKLEQNVRAFKEQEAQIGKAIYGWEGDDKERAGATLVGRFEDGTPIQVQQEDRLIGSGSYNNFNYTTGTGKCPHFAHIRKTNPRIDNKFDEHTMARRGIPYGHRNVDTTIQDIQSEQFPTRGVGLLFMSYQKSIVTQFEVLQSKANFNNRTTKDEDGKKHKDGGIDPVIGQSVNGKRTDYLFPDDNKDYTFNQHIHFKGGEYFFAPSMAYLASLAAPKAAPAAAKKGKPVK